MKSVIDVSCLSMLFDMYVERIVNGHTDKIPFIPLKKNCTFIDYIVTIIFILFSEGSV